MGDRREKPAQEYNPLADVGGLIGDVLERRDSDEQLTVRAEKIVPLSSKEPSKREPQPIDQRKKTRPDKLVSFRFLIPKSDLAEARRILQRLQSELDANFDMSNVARGWVTRLITAEKELVDAAQNHGPVKTANRRSRSEVAEVDHAMAEIQAMAFRRAKPIG